MCRVTSDLSKEELELLAVELRLVQLTACASGRLRGTEGDAHSPETLEHLEGGLCVVAPEQGLKALL